MEPNNTLGTETSDSLQAAAEAAAQGTETAASGTETAAGTEAAAPGGGGNSPLPVVAGIAVAVLVIALAAALLWSRAKRRERAAQARRRVKEAAPHKAPASSKGVPAEKPKEGGRASRPSTLIPPRVRQGQDAPEEPQAAAAPAETEIAFTPNALRYSVGAAQTVGKRPNQEDSYAISNWKDVDAVEKDGLLAAVADGIGGLADGELASTELMRSFCREFNRLDAGLSAQEKLLELTARGQREVLRLNHEGKHCGTTLVSLLIKGGELSTISVGDSRIALFRAGVLLQLNREHVVGREQDEAQVLAGSEDSVDGRKRAAITSYIGKEGLHLLDRTLNPIRLISGDRVLLMTDGVFNTLGDDELISCLNREPQEAAETIIQAVDRRNVPGQDNATIVIVGVN